MEVKVNEITDKDFTVDIVIKKEEYFEEFKKNLSLYKNNIKRKGFRNNNNTPIEVVYREYGISALESVCNKLVNDELKKITEDKKYEDKILYNPIVVESTFPTNKISTDFNNVQEIKFKYILGFIDKINIDDFIKNIKDNNIEVEELICNSVDDDLVKKMSNQFKFSYFLGDDRKISDDTTVLSLFDEKNIEVILPAKGVKIDDKEIDITNKIVGDTIEINVEDENSLKVDNEIISSVLQYKLKKGLNKFTVKRIVQYKEKEIKNDLLNKYLCSRIELDKKNDNWLIENIDIDKVFYDNYNNNEIDEKYEEKIRDLIFTYSNYYLKKLNRGRIREKLLDVFKIDIPENYFKEKAKSIVKINNEEILRRCVELLSTYNILEIIFTELIKKFDIKCTDDDIKKYTSLKTYMENNQEANVINDSFISKLKPGTFDRNSNPTDDILEIKAILKLKDIFKITVKEISYQDYLNLLN